jgi:hypothetical protein
MRIIRKINTLWTKCRFYNDSHKAGGTHNNECSLTLRTIIILPIIYLCFELLSEFEYLLQVERTLQPIEVNET